MYNDVLYKGLTLTIKKKTNTSPMEQHKISQYMDGQATNTSIKKKKKKKRGEEEEHLRLTQTIKKNEI